jgi:hypothetical protein
MAIFALHGSSEPWRAEILLALVQWRNPVQDALWTLP